MKRLFLLVGLLGGAAVWQRREPIRVRLLIWMIGSRPVLANVEIPAPSPRVLMGDHALILGSMVNGDSTAVRVGRGEK